MINRKRIKGTYKIDEGRIDLYAEAGISAQPREATHVRHVPSWSESAFEEGFELDSFIEYEDC